MLLLPIIAAVACLAVATLMYTPKMRVFGFYRPVALFFLFEGVWLLLDYIVRQINPDSTFTMVVHYIGLVVLAGYFALRIFFESSSKADKVKKKIKPKKKSD